MKEANFKETEIGKIPVDWEVRKIKDIAPLQRGFDLPISKIVLGEYPVVFSNGITHYHNIYKVKKPGIVTGRSGTIGNVFYVNQNFWPHNTSLFVTNFKEVIPKYIFYLFNFIDFEKYSTGSGVPTLNRNDLHHKPVPLPPLAEQEKIAEVLSDTDLWIESTEALLAKKRQIKKGAMQKLLSPKEDWEVRKLGEVVKIKKGEQFNSSLLNNESPFPCYSGGIEPSGFSEKFNEDGNCIIISEGGNSCGFINFVKSKFWLGGHCYKIISIPKDFDQLFLYQLLKYNQTEIMGLRVGSGLPNIQKKAIENFEIAFPTSKQTQQEIAEILSSMDLEIESLENRLQKARQLKQGMMQDLLTGKVRLE